MNKTLAKPVAPKIMLDIFTANKCYLSVPPRRKSLLTTGMMDRLGLNDRQRTAIFQVIEQGRLTNADYQELTGASRTTARRDLEELISKGLLMRSGKGRGAHYVLTLEWIPNEPNEPLNEP